MYCIAISRYCFLCLVFRSLWVFRFLLLGVEGAGGEGCRTDRMRIRQESKLYPAYQSYEQAFPMYQVFQHRSPSCGYVIATKLFSALPWSPINESTFREEEFPCLSMLFENWNPLSSPGLTSSAQIKFNCRSLILKYVNFDRHGPINFTRELRYFLNSYVPRPARETDKQTKLPGDEVSAYAFSLWLHPISSAI